MSREIPYSPMGKRKEVSHERMQEILAKHGGAVTSAKAEIPSPKPPFKGSSLKWQSVRLKDGTTSKETIQAEGYSVLRCTANGVATGRFLSFAPDKSVLGGFDSAASAKAACCDHFAKRLETAA